MTNATTPPANPESGSAMRVDGAPKKASLPAPSQGVSAPLPHEIDQALGQVAAAPDPVIAQAKRDIDAGMVDTDMRATPGLDAERRAQLVPNPTPTPTSTPKPKLGAKPGPGLGPDAGPQTRRPDGEKPPTARRRT